MEIRRIEGVLLQHAIEQSQSYRTQKAGEELRIRILSTVPNVLLELASGGRGLRAQVAYSEGGSVNLTVEGGFELKAENRSSLILLPGDLLELKLESGNPPIFKIAGLSRKDHRELIELVLKGEERFYSPINPEGLMKELQESGLFYEIKLLKLFLGELKAKDLFRDEKAHILQSLFAYAQNLSKMLNISYEQSLEGIKKLLEALKLKTEGFNIVSSYLKTLLLEDLSNQEYVKLVRLLESMGEVELLKAMESRDIPTFLSGLWRLTKNGVLEEYRALFEELKNFREPAVKEFFGSVVGSSNRDIKQAYKGFLEYMEKGRSLVEFYADKGQRMEELINRLEFITSLQWIMAKHRDAFYLPVHYEGGKGSLMFKRGQEYLVVFRFEYEKGFVAGLLRMPKSKAFLDVALFTDMENLAQKMRAGKDALDKMLVEEKIKLRSFSVNVSNRENLANVVVSSLGEGFLLLA